MLRALEKGLGRYFSVEVPVGESVPVGPLEVLALRCYEPPPDQVPESAAFLEIRERDSHGSGADPQIFRGWMFASSPSLSALEHPTLDVWVVDCRSEAGFPGGDG